MIIKEIFRKDALRRINGVIKVNDDAAASVWQELDEYVLTKELNGHFRRFFSGYLEAAENSRNTEINDRIGVWVSGFFGSGKSHFIKIISHLLHNAAVTNPASGESKRPIEFFDGKIADAAFYGDIVRAVETSNDVVLFNIDGKAGHTDGRDAVLAVFMRVLNELQGFCEEHPHLAEIERQLDRDGKYTDFQSAFNTIAGATWKAERHAYRFRRAETIQALTESTGMNESDAEKLIDETRDYYNLTVEGFARRVKEYLDRKGPNHRIIFVADEVGQFIGSDTHLMLSLQTIVENLGTVCAGRAWVVVTSQEDMDAVLDNVVGAKSNDFSKIQGRFPTRLSLSSSNTDEVIQARLLEKLPDAVEDLRALFRQKGDVLRNQLSFTGGASLKNYRDEDDFVRNYPFAPYHYQLVQAVFESIRKAGATGLHLARGERSMLDAFQMGIRAIAEESTGKLVPFYKFYPSVESFLDTAVAKTINQAVENDALEPFDAEMLRVLFLIRYVDIIKPSVDNLVTLCIAEVDDDRIALKQKIEASLLRLEKETLVSKNGDLFYFLTNEERDIGRAIKAVSVSSDEVHRQLSDILFGDLLSSAAKYTYSVNKKVFNFNRLVDGRPFQGSNLDTNETIEIITPFNHEFESFTQQKCVLSCTDRVLVKLAEHKTLRAELVEHLQTKRFINQSSDAAAADSAKRILRDKATENQQRYNRVLEILRGLVETADYYAAGQQLSVGSASTLAGAQDYLIKNTFNKLAYLNAPANDPVEEIKAVLIADLVGQQNLALDNGQPNSEATGELRNYINLRANANIRITLDELTQQFERKPFGWRDLDVALLTARLFAAGEIAIKIDGTTVEPRAAVESFQKPGRWKLVQILRRQITDAAQLSKARKLAHEVFGKMSPEMKEDELAQFIRSLMAEWLTSLTVWRGRAEAGDVPGLEIVTRVHELVRSQNAVADTFEFFRRFNEKEPDWHDAVEDFVKLRDFHEHQIEIWRRLRDKMMSAFKDNRTLIEADLDASNALQRLEQIRTAAQPYAMIREIEGLISTVERVNDAIVAQRCEVAIAAIEARIGQVKSELDSINADADTRNHILTPFQHTKTAVGQQTSIQHIAFQSGEHLDTIYQTALDAIEVRRQKIAAEKAAADAAAVRKLAGESDEPPVIPQPPPIVQKQTRTVRPALFATKAFIETEAELDDYLARIRAEIEKHLDENARIRIQ